MKRTYDESVRKSNLVAAQAKGDLHGGDEERHVAARDRAGDTEGVVASGGRDRGPYPTGRRGQGQTRCTRWLQRLGATVEVSGQQGQ